MRWFVVASVAVWSASALAADVSDGGVIPLPPVVVPLGAADIPNASSPTQRDPSATTTAIETKSRPVNAELTAETAFADLKNVMEFVLNADAPMRLRGSGRARPKPDGRSQLVVGAT